jgi:hypothetical protein
MEKSVYYADHIAESHQLR